MVGVRLILFAFETVAEMLLFHKTSNRYAICKLFGQQSLNLCHDLLIYTVSFFSLLKTRFVSRLVQWAQFCFVLYTHIYKVNTQNISLGKGVGADTDSNLRLIVKTIL